MSSDGVWLRTQMSDVMSSFSVASSALRTTEPVHQVVSHSLIDRAFYHASASRFVPPVPTANGERHAVSADRVDWQEMQSLDYMYFASAIAAEYMILTVRRRHRETFLPSS